MTRSSASPSTTASPLAVTVVVVGAGFGGLYALYCLRQMGFSAIAFEAGDRVGGTWYWNRYPGARCDVESLQYSYSFSEEFDQEWTWSEKYAPQAEITAYANHVADRFDLRRDIRFETHVVAATFGETTARWIVETDRGDKVSARFCLMAVGCLSAANKPPFEGMADFKGPIYHTGEWPKEGVDFSGLRVGVIGTGLLGHPVDPADRPAGQGADGVPAHRHLHRARAQRAARPRRGAPREGRLSGAARQGALAADRLLLPHQHRAGTGGDGRGAAAPVRGGLGARRPALPRRLRRPAVQQAGQRHHRRFRAGKNPWHRQGPGDGRAALPGQRVRLQAAVRRYRLLRDLQQAAREAGRRLQDADRALHRRRHRRGGHALSVRRGGLGDGLRRHDRLIRQDPHHRPQRADAGGQVAGFPNLFMITGPGSPSVLASMIQAIEQHVDWMVDLMAHMRDTGARAFDPKVEDEDRWVEHVNEVSQVSLRSTCSSWYVGANVAGRPRVFMPYIGGFPVYVQKCNEVMDAGYDGFVLEGAKGRAKSANAPPEVRLTKRWHVPLDMDVISPAMLAARRVPVV